MQTKASRCETGARRPFQSSGAESSYPRGEMSPNPCLTPHTASQVRPKPAFDREPHPTTFPIVFCEELSSYNRDWEQFLKQGTESSPGLGKTDNLATAKGRIPSLLEDRDKSNHKRQEDICHSHGSRGRASRKRKLPANQGRRRAGQRD